MQTATHKGHCTCGSVRWEMTSDPLFVNCCHCTWCQRETGTAFALNALIESDRLRVEGETEMILTISASGKGQEIARCPKCRVALWSHYAGGGRSVSFVRVGTAESPGRLPPGVHIFTSTKLPWVKLASAIPAFAEYYDPRLVWPAEAQHRFKALKARG